MSGIQNLAHLRLLEGGCEEGQQQSQPNVQESGERGGFRQGFYLVLWSARRSADNSGRNGRFFGPFASLAQAEKLRVSAEALGLVMAEAAREDEVSAGAARRRVRFDGASIILAGRAP